jgi:hypothetical protein
MFVWLCVFYKKIYFVINKKKGDFFTNTFSKAEHFFSEMEYEIV